MRTEWKIGLAVLLVWFVVRFFLNRDPAAGQIPALMKDGALVVDVRTAAEFAGGHIEGAVNIPYSIVASGIQEYQTDKSRPVIVYCHSGARAGVAKKLLHDAGYTNVINGGGYSSMRARLSR